MTAGSTSLAGADERDESPERAPPRGGRPPLRSTFSAFRYRGYRLLWISMAVGMTGMQMQMIARALLAFELSGTFTAVGFMAAAWGIPQFFFALPGGALADRMDKRRILLITQAVVFAQAVLIGVLITTDQISLAWLFVLGVALGATFSFNMPARQAFIPELVPKDELLNAIALNNTAMNATRLFSPLAAGAFIAIWGFDVTYYITAVLYAAGYVTILILPRSTAHEAGAAERGGVFDEIKLGLRYVGSRPALRTLMLMAFVPIVFGISYVTILPAFVRGELDQGEFAFTLLVGLSAVGALLGSLTVARLNPRSGLRRAQSMLGFGWGIGLVALGLGSFVLGYPGAVLASLALGFFQMGYMALNNAMLMTSSEPAYHGRIMSIYMLTFGVFPLMGAPLGVLGDLIGGYATFSLLGAGIIGFFALLWLTGAQRALPEGAVGEAGVGDAPAREGEAAG